jgi:SHAQKYF class myb-like DNA-binding protein
MFAVSRKPITKAHPVGKFIIRNEVRESTFKNEETAVKVAAEPTKNRIESGSTSTSLYNNLCSQEKKDENKVCSPEENKEVKRIKVRLSIIKDVPYAQKIPNESHNEKKGMKKNKEIKIKQKKVNREGSFNCGRWQPDEHERFIEAIMKYGNEWKSVQKYVGSRSSTQARSHAQKFFVKIKKANLLDFNLDLSKNYIKTLHEMANQMTMDEYLNAMKQLNCAAFERKSNKRRHNKEETLLESSFLGDASHLINLR